jgi:mRNA interferase YafQ
MYFLKYSKHFKKDLRKFKHDRVVLTRLENVLDLLVLAEPLAKEFLNHSLHGEFKGCFECHVQPDLLLIYKKEKSELLILLLRIGSHSDLF